MEINVQEGWVRKTSTFHHEMQNYDVKLVRFNNYTEVWTDPVQTSLIKSIPGVAFVGFNNEIPTCYVVQFDPRYDRMAVEEEIMKALMKDLENEN